MHELTDLFGETSDNAQLGYNDNGDLVAYDYGFKSESSQYLCSRINDCTYTKRNWEKYIRFINYMLDTNESIRWLERVTKNELNRAWHLRQQKHKGKKHYHG